MAITNSGGVDLESVLNVRRRNLASLGEKSKPRHHYNYIDTIYLKREDNSDSVLTLNSKILIFGELQLLCSIFERYTSNIIVYEESGEPSSTSPTSSNKPSFSATIEEPEEEGLPIISTIRKTSLASSKESTSPPHTPNSPTLTPGSPLQSPDNPLRRKGLNAVGRSHTVASTGSEFSTQSLEGKRYGCIQLPNMMMIEILEILLRTGLEIMDVSSDYDAEKILHQNFVFSKSRSTPQKIGLY
jgi:hypothetical protein